MNGIEELEVGAAETGVARLWDGQVQGDERRLLEMRPKPKTGAFYRPELDVLRFGCFLLVFFHHSFSRAGEGWRASLVDVGGFGVPVFFLLSSFLITELLLREREVSGRVHAGAFYLRRILRIWPLYFGFLGFCWVMGRLHLLHPVPTAMGLSFLAMAGNWYFVAMGASLSPAGILWSVSVEEQFYLVWPWLMRIGRVRVLAAVNLLMIAVAYVSLWRLAATGHGADMAIWGNTLVQMQFFAVGSLLAMGLRVWRPKISGVGRVVLGGMSAAVWMTAAWACRVKRFDATIDPVRACLGYALIVAGAVFLFGAVYGLRVGRGRVSRALVYLGRVSYGLYVFHILMINAGGRLLKAVGLPATQGSAVMVTVSLAMTIVGVVVSYELYERPFLRLKGRWTIVRSRNDGGRAMAGVGEPLTGGLAAREG